MSALLEKLSSRQLRVITLLVAGAEQQEAASRVGVAASTVRRWMNDPNFRNALHAAQVEAFREAMGAAQANMNNVIATLRNILNDETAPASSRVSAGRTILDVALKWWENVEIEERLSALEQQMESR